MAFDFGLEFGVDEWGHDGFGEFAGKRPHTILGHAPQVAEENALQFTGVEHAQQAGRREGGRHRQKQPPQAVAPEDELAEKELGVVGEQRAIEIEQGEAGHGRLGDGGVEVGEPDDESAIE